jgi:hypothetical protein
MKTKLCCTFVIGRGLMFFEDKRITEPQSCYTYYPLRTNIGARAAADKEQGHKVIGWMTYNHLPPGSFRTVQLDRPMAWETE